ncbi:LmbE family N-acetylglucosaminyl deacetylase [Palleronia aestuarii]|uniref:LmbE family N-acetylglucosaminyl deacetylase n=1 Tax=Palleronia aestuarii TaxID=568105 RepID=A0A2W7N8T6_9RHOB|nr:PIG-L family deacetylase [Palleronia aestuarii]PZX16498.1 LmbE family N-acetylglucosaminyl deacetylase [Palleronia aestuarii]
MSLDDLVEGAAPVLVLAPHPDDETLGCGLLLAERWARGRPAHVACLTDGAASHPGSTCWPGARLAELRRRELEEAIGRLGGDPARDLTWLGFPDAALHRLHGPGVDLARAVARLADELAAGTLLSASPADAHCDHEAGAEAAALVCDRSAHLRLWHYPIWSRWIAWQAGDEMPGLPLDLSARRRAKRNAIAAHRSQMGLVVRDDPDGFAMAPAFVERFCEEAEIYMPVRP